jgi:membrane protease YdiL (CAAX protease family)
MPLAAVVTLLVCVNVVANNVALAIGPAVLFALAMVAVLLGLARWDGLTAADLGLARADVRSGLRWGALAIGVVLVGYSLALLVPMGREAFMDERSALDTGDALAAALIRIPVATVVLEEIAFRGVLLAMASRRWGPTRGVLVSSLLFGFWHVLPAGAAQASNPAVSGTFGASLLATVAWVSLTVLGTGLAGLVFCWLRRRSGSLIAPMCLHWGTNGFGVLFGLIVRSAGG